MGSTAPVRRRARWLQANVGLRRSGGDALPSARALFDRLREAEPALRAVGLKRFFFVRKPPDVRLRLELTGGRAAERRVAEVLDAAVAERAVVRWWPSVYEPELHLFGGEAPMALVHDHSCQDTAAWLAWDRLQRAGGARLAVEVLSLAALSDLFLQAVEGAPEEAWDVWYNLALLQPGQARGEAPEGPALAAPALEPLAAQLSPAERRVLQRYARANRALARGLDRLWRQGALRHRKRTLLPFVAQLHWNRFGLGLESRLRICAGMLAGLDPRRGMR